MSDKRPKCPNSPKYPCGDCPACQVPPTSQTRTVQPPGFREAWPTREAIAAHQGGVGRWLVTDPYGAKTLGAFDGDTLHVLMRWHVVGAMVSEPTQPWKFEPYRKDTFTDEINRQRDRRGAPPAASDSPGRPQAPIPPEGLAAGPGIAPGLDAAGFGSWPSEEEIEAHGNGLWLIRQKGDMAPGQIRSMALGRLCPLTSAQLAVGLWPSQGTPHRATCKYVGLLDGKACACNLTECVAASPLVAESLGGGMEAPVFKDEHVQMVMDAKAKYAAFVGPAGFENDRIGRVDHAARILSSLPERSPDRRVLVVLRGLPGSGKSTVAQAIVDSDPARWVRVSKDDLRQMMVGPNGDLFRFVEDRAREMVVSKVAEETAMSALRLGLDVVVDATNLTNRALNAWHLAAIVANRDGRGPVLVCERAVPTPVEECVARDGRRGKRSVGEAVIRRLAATVDLPLEDRDWEAGS